MQYFIKVTAMFYQGDSNVLLLAPEGKKTYIQFAHNKQD